MHVLIIPSWYSKPGAPLYGSFIKEQARMLAKRGMKVGVLFPDWSGSFLAGIGGNSEEESYNEDGICTFRVELHSIIPRLSRLNYWSVGKRMFKVFEKYCDLNGHPDIIHSHSVFVGGVVGSMLAKEYELPLIHTEHASQMVEAGRQFNGSDIKTIRSVCDTSRKFIVVSSFSRNEMISRYNLHADKLQVVANVVNPIFLEGLIEVQKSEPFRLVVVGHLKERKGVMSVIEAVEKACERGVVCRLDIAGDGGLKEVIAEKIAHSKWRDQFHLLGSLGRVEIKDLLIASHALISGSRLETFGVNLIEAHACGRPVVATNSGGPEDIITPENGILLSGFDSDDLAQGILDMFTKYEQFDQKRIQKGCRDRYNEGIISDQLESMYLEALND